MRAQRAGRAARAPPIGALTYSITGAGCETTRSATFAVSIDEPPPTETKPSTPASVANAAACSTDSSVGSTRASAYTTTSIRTPRSRRARARDGPPPLGAVRLRAQPDHVAGVDVETALAHQPVVDRGVEEREVADV
jgi:hypothetical protein